MRFSGRYFVYIIVIICLLPIAELIIEAVSYSDSGFRHIYETVLFSYITNSVILTIGVVVLSSLFAIPAAWFVARYHFPMARYFSWLLMLPLALPSYVMAYLYIDWFDYTGPVQSLVRYLFGWQNQSDYWFFSIRSIGGAIFVLALSLYPYLFLLAKTAFSCQTRQYEQAAMLLKASPMRRFLKISLPLCWPAIIAGISLIAMESLSDFGAVQYFAVQTLTTAIYDTWLNLGSLSSAAKIALVLLVVIMCFIWLEKQSHKKELTALANQLSSAKKRLVGYKKYLVFLFCLVLFLLAFLLPFIQLVYYAFVYFKSAFTPRFIEISLYSFLIACIVSVACILISLLITILSRYAKKQMLVISQHLSNFGYAVPGVVLAIGVLILLTKIDYLINDITMFLFNAEVGLILSGSVFAISFAFVVRFLAISNNTFSSRLENIPSSIDNAATMLRHSPLRMFLSVHFPLMKTALIAAFILIFIEVIKELPAALILRPFNFEMLSTYVFQYMSDEMIEQASLGALLITLLSLVPLLWINRLLNNKTEQ
ncbi:ABC transporter permease [Fangia hongkongensis]|uniref:ABC transporter permease n=1 Tax=Fangia hongkongensis TaxID=270495 RepID=UPI00035E330F|nr:iron ABC transporter permease [Fangia hongkongensis]MBK2125186.1 iron ABC transporter permease [Fangia hongkongensis]